MKTFVATALLIASAVLLAPMTSAQANGQGIGIASPAQFGPVDYQGTHTLNVTVNVGCISATPSGSITITAPGKPEWLTFTSPATSAAPTASCAPSGSRPVSVPVTLTVAKQAPGVVVHSVNITATMGTNTAQGVLKFSVEYNPEFTLEADVDFPLNVTGGTATFNVTITQKSNARSMVMIENVSVSAGSLSGLSSVVYETDSLVKTFNVTYKAPTGAWTNATANFTAFTHYLLVDGGAGDFMAPHEASWTFVNAGGSGGSDDGPKSDDKKAPGLATPLLTLGLLALVGLARRR